MNLTTLALFFCGLFLQEAAASRRASCSGGLCCFQDSVDFAAAKEACENSAGQLIQFGVDVQMEAVEHLAVALGGRFWLSGGPAGCAAVSAGTVRSEPCQSSLDGFLCLYDPASVCGAVRSSVGTSVAYRTNAGFDVVNSETFPPGTVAEVRRPGAHHPDRRQLCFSDWLRAPWVCEVMRGGCDHGCTQTTCTCPETHSLHGNNISCVNTQPAASSSPPEVQRCADVPEPCPGEGERCVDLDGGYGCRCADDLEEEDGACVNMSMCRVCEHRCEKMGGVYQCACMEGFRVSPRDPVRCEQHCSRKECPAICDRNVELEKKDMQQCYCPKGYILDIREGNATCSDIDECDSQSLCEHDCENLFGGFRCACRKGYTLQGKEKCVRLREEEEEEEEEYASGSPPVPLGPAASTPLTLKPAALPSYIKTGSVLGIAVFLLLCAALLGCVVRSATRRCGRLNLNSLKHPDIDIFYLQQVTTETYKRLSFDKQSRNDSQRV